MIEVNDASRRYGGYTAVDHVSLRLRNGLVYGLLGPEGAGKSTLMNLIAGCLAPTEGEILAGGYDTVDRPLEARRQIGYMPKDFAPCSGETVHEFLGFVAEVKGVHAELAVRQVNEVTVAAGLSEVRDKLIRTLPEVMRRRLGVAQALLGTPDTLLLDEPLRGLDDADAEAVLSLIVRLGEKKTVLLSGTPGDRTESVCDRVFLMDGGHITEERDAVKPAPAAEAEAETETETAAEPVADDTAADTGEEADLT